MSSLWKNTTHPTPAAAQAGLVRLDGANMAAANLAAAQLTAASLAAPSLGVPNLGAAAPATAAAAGLATATLATTTLAAPAVAGERRAGAGLADYAQARFTGYGGSDIHLTPPPAPPPELNQVRARLRDDLARLTHDYRDFFDTHADMDPRAMTRTKEGWAVTWRRWALDDLGDQVAEMRNIYVIHRGDSFQHRLFLDRSGRELLAVQPQDPFSALRYRKLRPDQDLCDLYGPFARLSASPQG